MGRWARWVVGGTGLRLPGGRLGRWALLVRLGVVIPPLRRRVWARASALAINPAFRRRPPEGEFARMVFWQETGASAWAWFLLGWSATHGWRPPLTGIAVIALGGVPNQAPQPVAPSPLQH